MSGRLRQIFERWASGFVAPAPQAPEGFQPLLPETDAEEVEPAEGYELADCIGAAFIMHYVDAAGEESRRRVVLRRVVQRSDETLILQAYCHERKAPRHFRADRIQEFVHLGTGEIIADAPGFLRSLAAVDPTGAALDRCRPALQVMTFLGWADGFLDDREKLVMVDYVVDACEPGQCDLDRVIAYITALHPDEQSFYSGLRKLAGLEQEEAQRLVRALNRMARADGEIDETEFYYLVEAQRIVDK